VRRRIRRPPAHRALLAFCVTALAVLLLAQGFSTRSTGRSATPTAHGVRGPLAGQGSILVEENGRLQSREVKPGRRIALTFDDGPDPRWTPRIAALLHRLRVPATFFVVGSQVVRHPDVIRMLRRDGFELGNHTFTHADLSRLPAWQRALELHLVDSALAGITGRRPRLMRPPYSSQTNAVTPRQASVLKAIAGEGYLIALTDFDGEDWRRKGVPAILRGILPRGTSGGIVLLHDGGGNRSQTLAAVKQAVPRLRNRGFRFVTVSQLAGLPPTAADPPATGSAPLRGHLLIYTLAVARALTAVLTAALIAVAVLMVLRTILLVGLARRHARWARRAVGDPEFAPPVSIIVPAYNEAVGIERTVRALAASEYPDLEVIVVDDGSEDGTGALAEGLGLERVRVLREPNRGKALALNRGIEHARHDLIVTVDADTIFEPETVRRLVAPFRDPEVGAASGNTKVGNRRGMLGRWQHIEYVMGFNLDRRLYDILRCMPTIPGAIGAFRRAALDDIGNMSDATLAEDTDATLAVGRAGWRVVYVEDARAWTEAPASLRTLWHQRYRWSYGTMQAVWKHKSALWRRGEGRVGRVGIPYLVLFQIALPSFAPLVDVFALYGILFLNPIVVIAYWGGFNALQMLLALYAFRLDGESPRVLWAMPFQQLVYRQLMYLVVIESVLSALLGLRLRWHRLERTGDVEVAQ
jgi:cellulose synthase/poly-beta-1,6-N-acetylglucosamine synthase-like glycosyltransferase/peptidoglycan/xylan/chitin deacetylase (PgdA/CDA1 family)